jgi:hypothetical protein
MVVGVFVAAPFDASAASPGLVTASYKDAMQAVQEISDDPLVHQQPAERDFDDRIAKLAGIGRLLDLQFTMKFQKLITASRPARDSLHIAAAYKAAQRDDFAKFVIEVKAIESPDARARCALRVAREFFAINRTLARSALHIAYSRLPEVEDKCNRVMLYVEFVSLSSKFDEFPVDFVSRITREDRPDQCSLLMQFYLGLLTSQPLNSKRARSSAMKVLNSTAEPNERSFCIGEIIEALALGHESEEASELIRAEPDSLERDQQLRRIVVAAYEANDCFQGRALCDRITRMEVRCRTLVDVSETLHDKQMCFESCKAYNQASEVADEIQRSLLKRADTDIARMEGEKALKAMKYAISMAAVHHGDYGFALNRVADDAAESSAIRYQVAMRQLSQGEIDTAIATAKKSDFDLRSSAYSKIAGEIARGGEFAKAISLFNEIPVSEAKARDIGAYAITNAFCAVDRVEEARAFIKAVRGDSGATDPGSIMDRFRKTLAERAFTESDDSALCTLMEQIGGRSIKSECLASIGRRLAQEGEGDRLAKIVASVRDPWERLGLIMAAVSWVAQESCPYFE